MAKRVAVIILNWNGENLLREFLPSVMKNTNLDLGVSSWWITVRRMVPGYVWNKSFQTWNGCCSRRISDLLGVITGRSR